MAGTTVEVYPGGLPRDVRSRDAAQRRRWRWDLLRWQWSHSQLKAVRQCRLWPVEASGAGLYLGPDGSYLTGLKTCKSVWSCPVCSAIIRQRRAVLIERDGVAWTSLEGRWLAFLTLTLRHDQFDSLDALYGALRACWKALRQHRYWRSLPWEGFWRSVEVTLSGRGNGWHPHLHVLLFGEGPVELGAIGAELGVRWRDLVVAQGLKPTTLARGTRLQPVSIGGESMARYLSKVQDGDGSSWGVGQELARSDMKRGRGSSLSPFQVLEAASDGEARMAAKWWEYEVATKGRRAQECSRNMEALTGIPRVEDEDLAEEDQGGEVICYLDAIAWNRLAWSGYVPDVLEIAERGDGPETVRFIEALLRVVR